MPKVRRLLVKFVKSRAVKLVVPLKDSFPKLLIVFGSFSSVKFVQFLNNPSDMLVIFVLLRSTEETFEPSKTELFKVTVLSFANLTVCKFGVSLKAVAPIEFKFLQLLKSRFVSFEVLKASWPIDCNCEFSGKTISLMLDPQKVLLFRVVRLAGKVRVIGVSALVATSVKALFWIVVKASQPLKSRALMFAPRKASWPMVVSFLHCVKSTFSTVVFWKAPVPIEVMFGSKVKSTFCKPVQPLNA